MTCPPTNPFTFPSLGPVARAVIARFTDAIASRVSPTERFGSARTVEAGSSPAVTVGSALLSFNTAAARECDHCALRLHAVTHACYQLGPLVAEITVYRSGLSVARLGPLAYFNSPNLGAWIGRTDQP